MTPSGLSPHLKALAIFFPAAGTSYCHVPSELGLGAFSGVAVISHHRLGGIRLVLFVQW